MFTCTMGECGEGTEISGIDLWTWDLKISRSLDQNYHFVFQLIRSELFSLLTSKETKCIFSVNR